MTHEQEPQPAERDNVTEQTEATEEKTSGPNKKYGKLSKKNKALTGIIKKVIGGATGGGWDHNHNETMN